MTGLEPDCVSHCDLGLGRACPFQSGVVAGDGNPRIDGLCVPNRRSGSPTGCLMTERSNSAKWLASARLWPSPVHVRISREVGVVMTGSPRDLVSHLA
jgi:hypothetical protein